MSSSDSTFLFEIVVKEFTSYTSFKELTMQCEFCDIFNICIKDFKKGEQSKSMRKTAVRCKNDTSSLKKKVPAAQSVLISVNATQLLSKMQNFPMKIHLKEKSAEGIKKIGTTNFVWGVPYQNFIKKVFCDDEMVSEIKSTKRFNIFKLNRKQEIVTFKASIKLKIIETITTSNYVLPKLNSNNILQSSQSNVAYHTSVGNSEFDSKKLILCGLTKSTIEFNINKCIPLIKAKSSPTINVSKAVNMLNYIFGCGNGPQDKQVYYVGYFTVEAEDDKNTTSHNLAEKTNESESICIFHRPSNVNISQCKNVACEKKTHTAAPVPHDPKVLLNLDSMYNECCDFTEKIEEVVGDVKAKMQFGRDPCFCTCECTFGFTKKTTYCGVCGGYEKIGEDLSHKPKYEMPVPCPVFHKTFDKSKLKVLSTSGSDSSKKKDSSGSKIGKTASRSGTSSEKRSVSVKKSASEKEKKIGSKRIKDERFKFNYGYKGIPPQIGHSQCAMPCRGSLVPVPKSMGWLWNTQDVIGRKFNPQWRPGAIHKFVLRLLKIARNPHKAIAKKKKRDTGKKKRPLKRPLLVISKKSGDYTVTMETMKTFTKPRQINQHPYEDKPVLTYSVGRTEEENRARQKKKEREQRRLERAQRLFIQSAFRDMCQEICLKTYQQALGILPDAEGSKCPCYPMEPGPDKTNINVSCSCSEDSVSLSSDTESDEWVIEFTPPNATFDPAYKNKKILKIDNSSQYTYLDFRVKLLDRYGKPVPRFFKGPDGKQQCSDLGGFWSPDNKWLEINVDGFIGPDKRWAPNIFIGPNGETVDGETGKFQTNNGNWLTIGIDGYIDPQGKWRVYPKAKSIMSDRKHVKSYDKSLIVKYKKIHKLKKVESTWSCFGDVSPKQLSEMGISGHGADRKLLLKRLQEMLAKGEPVNIPESFRTQLPKKKLKRNGAQSLRMFTDQVMCTHSKPSNKGIEVVDEYGNKTYFHRRRYSNKRPKQRVANLVKQGISLSSFHTPCFRSFISSEIMKKQLRERLKARAAKHTNTDI